MECNKILEIHWFDNSPGISHGYCERCYIFQKVKIKDFKKSLNLTKLYINIYMI